MEEIKPKWFNNKTVVTLLCIFIFPVGLYGLWKSETISKFWKISITVLITIVLVAGLLNDETSTAKTKSNQSYADLSATVQVKSDDYVKATLKYPDGWEYERHNVTRNNDTIYTFQAIVLAKNGFGVRSRIFYNVQLTFHGTKDQSHDITESFNHWEVLKSDVSQ